MANKPDHNKNKKINEKDEIIVRQMEVIRSLTENNLRRVGSDFWGADFNKNNNKNNIPESGNITSDKSDKAENNNNQANQVNQENDGRNETNEKSENIPVEKIEDLQAELDNFIGLDGIKQEVKSLINLVKVYQMRRENNLSAPDLSLHMVFTGNPGTGKTTIARLMSRIYHSLGIVSKGHLIETDRGGLVAGYVGQTAMKTGKVIESAIGGVLFIDEAYTLNGRGDNDFGQEAIDTLLKAMEDRRGEFIVIVAGYDELMDRFIHSNPGLESRFNRFLHFDDYNLEELIAIFKMRCEKENYTLSDSAEKAVRRKIEIENGPSFGNARGVRNLFEKALTRQANRLAGLESVTREQLMEITAEDIDGDINNNINNQDNSEDINNKNQDKSENIN